jgi:hypothetical protein
MLSHEVILCYPSVWHEFFDVEVGCVTSSGIILMPLKPYELGDAVCYSV